jgi:hypothetical protein
MRVRLSSALIALSFTSLFVTAVHARQNTYVASYGADSGACSYTAPCRNFSYALGQVDSGGIVMAIDSAGYSSFIINKAVTIAAPPGVVPLILPSSGGSAITINAPANAAVNLQGLTLDGTGVAMQGVYFLFGGSLTIKNSVIRNFTASGVALVPNLASTIAISDTLVSNNGGHGIFLQPPSSVGHVTAVFNRVEAYKNAQAGIGIFGNLNTGGNNDVTSATAIDCVAAYNDIGYQASGSVTSFTEFRITRSSAVSNSTAGVTADSGADAVLSQSELEGNSLSWSGSNSGGIITYGDNYTFGLPPPGQASSILSKF